MKTDYTYSDIHGMNVKELRSLLGKMNKEARKRAGRLRSKGYAGRMVEPTLIAVRGLSKVELEEAILDYAQAYLRDSRSTIKGMRSFEARFINSLYANTGLQIKRNQIDDFIDYIEAIKSIWGSMRYPTRNAIQVYQEMSKAGISGKELGDAFSDFMKSSGKSSKSLENKLLDLRDELKSANRNNERISADGVMARLQEKKGKRK